jgi:hypothetical protein
MVMRQFAHTPFNSCGGSKSKLSIFFNNTRNYICLSQCLRVGPYNNNLYIMVMFKGMPNANENWNNYLNTKAEMPQFSL